MAIPAVALLVAIGLERLVHLAARLTYIEHRWADLAMGLLMLGVAVGSVRYYYIDYSPQRWYGSENVETATMIGHYLSGVDRDYRAYFWGPPRLYWGFGSISFLAPEIQGQDVVDSLQGPPTFVDDTRGAVFLLLPERAAELTYVQQAFRGGRLRQFYDTEGSLRFLAYEVSPPSDP
jgi:hypothetical protein